MVSMRWSGSLSGNTNKRSSPLEDKSPSPKRQKVDNSGPALEKAAPTVDDLKKFYAIASGADSVECGSKDPPISDGASRKAVNFGKDEATLAALVSAPIVECCCLSCCCSLCMFKYVDYGLGEFEFFEYGGRKGNKKVPLLFHYCASDDTLDIVFLDWSF